MRFLLQITLRVKESEVQCLKQAIESLKDELQSAQRVRLKHQQRSRVQRMKTMESSRKPKQDHCYNKKQHVIHSVRRRNDFFS